MYEFLLWFHIAGGVVVLLAPAGALATSKGSRWHIVAGRVFVLGMLVVFVTAVPITVIRPNVFLFGVAVVSFYFALTGWLRARNRSEVPVLADWVASVAMASIAVAMCLRAIPFIRSGDPKGTALLVFGAVGGILAIRDIGFFRNGRYHGAVRIEAHLRRMLAGTGAALTAFTVTVL